MASLAVAMGVLLIQPAQANVLDYLQQFFGGVNNSVNYAEARRMTELDADRAELGNRISAALRAGRITPVEAAKFTAALENNRSLQFQLARSGKFSVFDANQVASAITNINNDLQNAISTNIAVKPKSGSRFGLPPSGYVNRAQVENLQNQISTKLQRGLANGRLTRSEYNRLRAELINIQARKQQMLSPRGFLSFSENQRLLSRLNRLEDMVRIEMNNSQVAGDRGTVWY